MQPTTLTPSVLPSLPVPGDRIVVVKGKKHPVGSTGTVLATGSKRFGGGISRWAKIRWDLNVEDTFISLDNLSRL